jgi:phytoene dehydrogenase-like protein
VDGYDTIVIDADVNGPPAALHLATKGWNVVVLEGAEVASRSAKTSR